MSDYKTEIEEIIKAHFEYITTWNSEISVISSMDTTFLITKKNFLIVWFNSVNEFLIEKIILLYYEQFLESLEKETGFSTYSTYELHKIKQIIANNHDWSFEWFSAILWSILWNVIGKWKIEKYIEDNFSGNLPAFKWLMKDIRKWRNRLWHTSEYYFKMDNGIEFDLNKIGDYTETLQSGFISLSSTYFDAMQWILDFQYKVLSKFPDIRANKS